MKKLVDIPSSLNAAVDQYQAKNGCTFAWIVRTSIENLLKSEGFISESEDQVEAIKEIIREMLAEGMPAEEINKHLRALGRKEVA